MPAAKDEQSQGLASAPRRQRSGSISSLIPRVSTPGKSLVSRLRPWSALGGSRASSSRDTCQQQQQPADLPDERSAERSQSEFAQQLLAGVYKRRLPEHEAAAVLEACPEIEWLADRVRVADTFAARVAQDIRRPGPCSIPMRRDRRRIKETRCHISESTCIWPRSWPTSGRAAHKLPTLSSGCVWWPTRRSRRPTP
ncbi:unnamed protein product [Prorocentrum cordatum]|uniref:Uncharacterized protein n=1 Tax=Prorocentrum cordatum TaxID=2364126 RepID=A0ABN9RJQ0_9DINO|nr:unnamed protein product [Polarella glacialis]